MLKLIKVVLHRQHYSIVCIIVLIWLDSPEHVLICDLVRDNRIVRDLRQLSPNTQTSALESFHAVVNHFAPKMIHFHYLSMLTR